MTFIYLCLRVKPASSRRARLLIRPIRIGRRPDPKGKPGLLVIAPESDGSSVAARTSDLQTRKDRVRPKGDGEDTATAVSQPPRRIAENFARSY
jgi:hypothetical protein